jgi:hypothetical protein
MAKQRDDVTDIPGLPDHHHVAASDDPAHELVDIGCWEPVNVGPRSSGVFATAQGYEFKRAQNGIEIWKDGRGTLVPWSNLKYVSLTENFKSRPIASQLSSLASDRVA